MKFHVWHESDGEESATEREADSAREAVKEFVQETWTSDLGETLCLVVRDPDGIVRDIEIDVDFEPTFYVNSVKIREPDPDDDTPTGETVIADVPHEGAL